MNRAPSTLSIVVAALAATLALGCGKSADKGKGKSAVEKSALKVFPADADLLAGINGPELRKSKFFDQIKSKLPGEAAATLGKFKECGIDVLGNLASAMLAAKTQEGGGLIEVKGFYRTDFKMCDGVEGLQIKDEGKLTAVTSKTKTQYLGWVADDTFIGGPHLTADQVEQRLDAKQGLDSNANLMKLLSKVDTKAALWMVFSPPGGKLPVPMAGDLSGIYGSVWLDGGLKLKIGLRAKDKSAADQLVTLSKQGQAKASQELGELGKYAEKIQVKADGSDVIVSLQLTDDELVALIEAAKKDPRIQMMMSMMRQ